MTTEREGTYTQYNPETATTSESSLAAAATSGGQGITTPAPATSDSKRAKESKEVVRQSTGTQTKPFVVSTEFSGKTLFRISPAIQSATGDWGVDSRFSPADFEMAPARASVYGNKGQDVPGAGASGFRETLESALVRLNVPTQRPIYQDFGISENCLYLTGGFLGYDNGDILLSDNSRRSHNAWAEYMNVKDVIRQGRPVIIQMVFWNGLALTHDSGKLYRGMVERFDVTYATAQRMYYQIKIQLTNRESLYSTHKTSKLLDPITPPSDPGISSLGRRNFTRMQADIAAQLKQLQTAAEAPAPAASEQPSPSPSPSVAPTPVPTPVPTPMDTPKPKPSTTPVPKPAVPSPKPTPSPTPTPLPVRVPANLVLPQREASPRPSPTSPAVRQNSELLGPPVPPKPTPVAVRDTSVSVRYTVSDQEVAKLVGSEQFSIDGAIEMVRQNNHRGLTGPTLVVLIEKLDGAANKGLTTVMTPEWREEFVRARSILRIELSKQSPSRTTGTRPTR